jgi:two-component system response regulator MprA
MKVLVAEDDRAVREAVVRALSLDGYQTLTAADGQEALRLVASETPDLLLLDWMMPGLSGLDVITELRTDDNRLPILMLTARDSVSDRVTGLEAGADDYLIKPFALAELRARIGALSRRTQASEHQLQIADLVLDCDRHIARRDQRELALGRVEWLLLEALVRHAGTVRSRRDLHLDVWDYDFGSTSNTLDVHIGYLRRKLEAEGEPRLIHTVRGFGYILEER